MAKYIILDPEVNQMLHCIDYLVFLRCIFCPIWTYYSWNSDKWIEMEQKNINVVYWIRFSLIFQFYLPLQNLIGLIISLICLDMDPKGVSIGDLKKTVNLHTNQSYYTQVIVYFCNTVFGLVGIRLIYCMEKSENNWFLFSIFLIEIILQVYTMGFLQIILKLLKKVYWLDHIFDTKLDVVRREMGLFNRQNSDISDIDSSESYILISSPSFSKDKTDLEKDIEL